MVRCLFFTFAEEVVMMSLILGGQSRFTGHKPKNGTNERFGLMMKQDLQFILRATVMPNEPHFVQIRPIFVGIFQSNHRCD